MRPRLHGAHRPGVGRPRAVTTFACSRPGSGAKPLEGPLGAKFVQEVNSVTLAVETLHPDAGSVVELGGQDAKIIVFKENEKTGDKSAIASMNDKCASGTGATIDKCMIKVGMPPEETLQLHFDDTHLHHVAAKCGVFAETDIVNLVKTGIPVRRNHVLAGRRHRHAEPLGAHARQHAPAQGAAARRAEHFPAVPAGVLAQAHSRDLGRARLRLPEGRAHRGADPVPDNAALYAAYGAVMYGMHEPAHVGVYEGLDGLRRYITEGRKERLGESAGPPLSKRRGRARALPRGLPDSDVHRARGRRRKACAP